MENTPIIDKTRQDNLLSSVSSGKKYKLAYIIPTKNSADFLDGCLEAMKSSFLRFNACVYVLDASEDDQSLRVYEKHKTTGIIYEKMPAASLEYRFFYALSKVDSEYICLGKDNQFPKYYGAETVMSLLDKNYDILQITRYNKKNLASREYHTIREICIDLAYDAGLFGTVFLRKSVYRPVTYEQFYVRYGSNEFFYLIYYYNYLINSASFKAFFCARDPYGQLPPPLQQKRCAKEATGEQVIKCSGFGFMTGSRRSIGLNLLVLKRKDKLY